jgi:D-alanyl-D-alanine carboxypeptidase
MSQTALPPDDDTTLPDPVSHGYLSAECVKELVADGGTATEGTDTTDWSASSGQGAGGMTSTLGDLAIWAASGSGSSLLSPELAARRLETHGGDPPFRSGLGIMDVNGQVGHEGEALGWAGWAGTDRTSGQTVVVLTNTCGVGDQVMGLVATLDPAVLRS